MNLQETIKRELNDEITLDSDEEGSEAILGMTEEYVTEQLLRSTPEYRAFVELEFMKLQEKERFKRALKEKEREYTQMLQQEIERQKEQAMLSIKQKEREIDECEQKLKNTIAEAEKKRKQLTELELDLRRRKVELDSDYQRKISEMDHNIKLVKEECAHKIALEREKVEEYERSNRQLQERLMDLQQQNQQLLDDYHAYQKKMANTELSQLQSEIQRLTIENTKLEKELQEATKAKQIYKSEWKKAVEELKKMKRLYHEEMNKWMRLQKYNSPRKREHSPPNVIHYQTPVIPMYQQQTIPQNDANLKEIRNLIEKVSDIVKEQKPKDVKQQKDVNESVEKFRQSSSSSISTTSERSSIDEKTPRARRWENVQAKIRTKMSNQNGEAKLKIENIKDEKLRNEVKRLLEEKAYLLQTGAYEENSDLIRQLNEQIKSLSK